MKKILVSIIALFATLNIMIAQTASEISASAQRLNQIKSLVSTFSGNNNSTTVSSVDKTLSNVANLAQQSTSITDKLNSLSTQVKALKSDNKVESTIAKAALLKSCQELVSKNASQTSGVATNLKSLLGANSAISKIKDSKTLAKAKTAVSNAKTVLNLLGIESKYQNKTLNTLINSLK